ncbi:translation elongation factor [Lentibacillus cibarius]|uniref:Translation elongation factor n=1 Tax=Lentibacillus cibarius TaxID=2583219 RepID=A0A549YEP0_9BACI|nr:translation elongation factor [Lentibacillus cibarius]TRM10351.1 translation elongation factor [Lentibacillus cibarius]
MNLTDKAWNNLFDRYNILDEIQENGTYEIKAKTIREEREPRLMAKFDHSNNLPKLFKEYGLSILPLTRSSYVIGDFDVYKKVTYDNKIKPKSIYFPPHITTIDPTNLYSESSALHCAFVTGMIDEVLGEEAVQTISGRMSSKEFDFDIRSKKGFDHTVNIKNAQVEIDGGYESNSYFMLIEAKKESVDDFLVRQLFYPYRLWQDKTPKQIKPVFFTHSNDVFSFFVYEFTDDRRYNSLRLVEQKDFIIAHEEITLEDILGTLDKTTTVAEPQIAFPQADSFTRIVDLLGLLVENDLSKDHITMNYDFDDRQTNYYTTAGIYLGLIERYINDSRKEVMFKLTSRGRKIMASSYKQKYLGLVSSILEHEPFRQVLIEYIQSGYPPEKSRVVEIMKRCNLYNIESDSTYKRRSSSIFSWIDWILDLTQA